MAGIDFGNASGARCARVCAGVIGAVPQWLHWRRWVCRRIQRGWATCVLPVLVLLWVQSPLWSLLVLAMLPARQAQWRAHRRNLSRCSRRYCPTRRQRCIMSLASRARIPWIRLCARFARGQLGRIVQVSCCLSLGWQAGGFSVIPSAFLFEHRRAACGVARQRSHTRCGWATWPAP